MNQLVLVLDFDGQYSKSVAQMVRGLSVYAEIKSGHAATRVFG